MTKDKIGVFDSGMGGLTVLRRVVEDSPGADIIYFGDTKHAPYGDRSQAELGALTANTINFLKGAGANKFVAACNSVSTLLMGDFFTVCGLGAEDIIEMSKPTAKLIHGEYNRVLVLATVATVDSAMYKTAFSRIGISTDEIAITGLVDLIEKGATQSEIEEHIISRIGIIQYNDYDAVVLACTHFPIVRDVFSRICGSDVDIVDPAHAVASALGRTEWNVHGNGSIQFFISEESQVFRDKVKELFGGKAKISICT